MSIADQIMLENEKQWKVVGKGQVSFSVSNGEAVNNIGHENDMNKCPCMKYFLGSHMKVTRQMRGKMLAMKLWPWFR